MKYNVLNLWSKCIIICFWLLVIAVFLYAGEFISSFNKGKNINVLVWGQVLDKEFLSDFEKETGIQVNMSYFENNEELFVKLQSSTHHDYDLIMPSDWAVQLMIQKGLVKKLDRNRIQVWDTIYPALCNHYFDPNNDYSIPFYWSLFGLGVDMRYFCSPSSMGPRSGPPCEENRNKGLRTWGLIFDEKIMPKRISTVEDIRELICIAALYLFGRYDQLNNEEIEHIKTLLLKQKRYVEIYTDSRPEYVLASGAVPVVVSWFGDFLKVMRQFDYIDFIVPKEGAFAVIDSFAIPAASKKDDLIYPFINYLFRQDIVKQYADKFDFFPAVNVEMQADERFAEFMYPTNELFKKVHFFKNVVSKDVLNDVLIRLKA